MLNRLLLFILCIHSLFANAQWQKINIPSSNDLYDIQLLNNVGYAIGFNNALLKTTDTGKTWKNITLSIPLNGRSLFFIDSNTGFITGENARILKTTNGGISWNQKFIRTAAYAYDVKFNGNKGISVGNNLLAFSTNDLGETWHVDTTLYSKKQLNNVCILPNGKCWAVGDSGYILYKNIAEKRWQKIPNLTTINLNHISNFGDSILMISGGMQDTIGGVSAYKNIFIYSKDSGNTWQQTFFNEMKIINKAWYTNKDTAYFIGNSGLVSKSFNIFSDRSLQLTKTASALNAISFYNNVGIIVGDGGTLLRTTNAGGFRLNSPSITSNNNNLHVFPNPSKGEINISMEDIKVIEVFDLTGKSIPFTQINFSTLHIAHQGIFILCITNKKGSKFYAKILIEE